MADDTATLQLLVDVRQGNAAINEFAGVYQAALEKLRAATAAGVEPSSAEFRRLQAEALKAGQDLLLAGEQGLTSMSAMAAATGKPIAEIAALEAEIAALRGQLKVLSTENTTGLNIVGANVEKLGSKFTKLSQGLLAGFALGPVVGVISLLTEALGKAIEKLQEFAIRKIAGEETNVRFTSSTRLLTDSLQKLAERQDRLSQADAEGIAKQTGYRLSVDQVRTAVEAHNAAIADATSEFDKNTGAGASVEQRRVAIYKLTVTLREAEAAYALALKGTTEQLAAEAAASDAASEHRLTLYQAIRGGNAALEEEKADLLLVIAQVEQHGLVNEKVRAKIKEQLTAEVAQYDEWGKAVPADLQIVANAYGVLTEAQQKAKTKSDELVASTIKAFAAMRTQDGQAGAPKPAGDAQKRVDSLKDEVAALEAQQAAGATTAQQDEALLAKKGELADAQIDLNRATLDGAKATDTFGEANQQAASNVQETVNQLRLAHGEIDAYGTEIDASNQDIADAAKLHGKLADGVTEVTDATVAATAATVDNAKSLSDAEAASKALGAGTDALSKSLGDLGDASDSGGKKLSGALDEAHAGALAVDTVLKRIDEDRFPSLILKAEKLASILAGGGQPGAVGN